MKNIVLTFGIIAGVIVSAMLFISFGMDFEGGELLGYATMVIAFATIFFGVKTYRDKYQGGVIKFGKAFLMGLYITLIASTMYVASWMVISETYGKDYMEEYYRHSVEELQKSDRSQEQIDQQIEELKAFKELYKNPAVKIGITYTEILPVGLLVSLISAALLKRKPIK